MTATWSPNLGKNDLIAPQSLTSVHLYRPENKMKKHIIVKYCDIYKVCFNFKNGVRLCIEQVIRTWFANYHRLSRPWQWALGSTWDMCRFYRNNMGLFNDGCLKSCVLTIGSIQHLKHLKRPIVKYILNISMRHDSTYQLS